MSEMVSRRFRLHHRRNCNICGHQTERAGSPLSSTLAELRAVVAQALAAGTCSYCVGA
jgi:hypothetical protein